MGVQNGPPPKQTRTSQKRASQVIHRMGWVFIFLTSLSTIACTGEDVERGVRAPASSPSAPQKAGTHERVDVYVMAADGTGLQRLTHDALSSGTNIEWSPQGHRILFSRGTPDSFGIYVMASDGTRQMSLVPPDGHNVAGSWMTDGTIVISSDRSGSNRLYTMSEEGTDIQPLPNTRDGDYFPVVSPDGKTVAFMNDDGPESDIWKMDMDGSARVALAVSPLAQKWTSWSPDGTHLAYHDLPSQTIRIADVDSGESRELNLDRAALMPDWSPDGRHIAFVSEGDVCLVKLATKHVVCFERKGEEFGPRWSPDGERIAFAFVRD